MVKEELAHQLKGRIFSPWLIIQPEEIRYLIDLAIELKAQAESRRDLSTAKGQDAGHDF